jgi:MFS family permease
MTHDPSTPRGPIPAFLRRSFPDLLPRRLRGIRWFTLDGLFNQVSGNFYEDFFILFALATGIPANRIGLLASAGGLASALAFIPGALAAGRVRARKPLILITAGGIARAAILGLAFLPGISVGGAAVIFGIFGLRFTTTLMGSFAGPAWTTFAADLVPQGIRGRYFAARNALISIIGAGASATAGVVIRSLDPISPDGLLGYRVSFTVAFILGMLATTCFSRIPEAPARAGSGISRRARDVIALVKRNPAFAWLAVSSGLWGLALSAASPYFNVYLVTHLGGNAQVVGIGSGIAALTGLAGFALFGRMADRRGNRRVLILTGLMVPFMPTLWVFVRAPWHTYLTNIPSGFFWAGYNLASFNLLLEMSPQEDREAGVALYQTLVATSAVVGPLLGGWLIDRIGYVPMFVVSGAGRMAATLLFIVMARKKS